MKIPKELIEQYNDVLFNSARIDALIASVVFDCAKVVDDTMWINEHQAKDLVRSILLRYELNQK
jgi:hypothetical protein